MAGPKFSRFVKAVRGSLVPIYGTGRPCEMIGATRTDKKGDESIEWDVDRIYPLTEEYCRRYCRELNGHVRRGELLEVTEADYKNAQSADRIALEALEALPQAELRSIAKGPPAVVVNLAQLKENDR